MATIETEEKRGIISIPAVSRLLCYLNTTQASGVFAIRGQWRKMDAMVRQGRLVEVNSNFIREDSLGAFLVEQQKITEKEHKYTLRKAKEENRLQGEVLVDMNMIDPIELNYLLANHKRLKFLRLFQGNWDRSKFRFLPYKNLGKEPTLQPVVLADVIKEGVLRLASGKDLRGRFLPDGKLNAYFVLGKYHEKIAANLAVPPPAIDMLRYFHNKALVDIYRAHSTIFPYIIRTMYLLALCKGAGFVEKPIASRYPSNFSPTDAMLNEVISGLYKGNIVLNSTEKETEPPSPQSIEQAEESDRAHYKKLLEKAGALVAHQKFEEALPLLQECLRFDGEDPEAIAFFAWVRFQRGKKELQQCEDCESMLRFALSKDQKSALANLYMGKILKHENRYSQAAPYFRKAYSLDPDNEEIQREYQLIQMKRRADPTRNA